MSLDGKQLVMPGSLQPMDCSPPGSSVHGIFQARILKWVARRSFSPRGSNLGLSLTAGRFFTDWAIREALNHTLFKHTERMAILVELITEDNFC